MEKMNFKAKKLGFLVLFTFAIIVINVVLLQDAPIGTLNYVFTGFGLIMFLITLLNNYTIKKDKLHMHYLLVWKSLDIDKISEIEEKKVFFIIRPNVTFMTLSYDNLIITVKGDKEERFVTSPQDKDKFISALLEINSNINVKRRNT